MYAISKTENDTFAVEQNGEEAADFPTRFEAVLCKQSLELGIPLAEAVEDAERNRLVR